LKHKLVQFLEDNKIQTRNYFAGNILMHPGYSFLDDYKKYPEANKVLDKVFFIGAAPHYNENVFEYIQDTIKKF
jgi:CDP-6-deoxy-D-xylo-4-hexulose-3-dehydrase